MVTRRQILGRGARGLGAAALAMLLDPRSARAAEAQRPGPHFAPRARRAIYLHMLGAPSQLETFDHKPGLVDLFDKELPPSVRGGQRLTGMTSGQSRFPIAPSIYGFSRHGRSGTWVSELLPWTAKMADDICVVRTMYTEAINHEPAVVFIQTGSQAPGSRASARG